MDKTPAQVALAELDEQREALQAEYRRIHEELTAVRELRDEAVDARLAELTDDEIMGDETLLRWMLRESFWHTGANNRKKALSRWDGIEGFGDPSGYDGREEWANDVLPLIPLAMVKDQDVTEVAAKIRAWAAVWTLGRPDVPVDIMERTLSEHGSYGALYVPETDTMSLRIRVYGSDRDLSQGPLETVLAYIAKNVWYRKPGAEGAWDSRDNEDED